VQRDLVEQAQRGDHDAFAILAGATVGRLDAVARLILRDPERAKDAVQDAFVRAWRDLPTLRDPDRFDAWIRRLVVHACLNEARRTRRRPLEVELLPIDHPAMFDTSSAVADRDQIERGFRRLEPEQRAIIVLHYYLGYPLPDAAETLGIPVGTAKSRLHRAIQVLRGAVDADARPTPAIVGPRA
jgi:RNA polymerase sigma-70 factor (ECF subfamily)